MLAPGEGIAVAAGDGMVVPLGDGIAVAAGDGIAVACAITLSPSFPRDAWPDGAATAVSPKTAQKNAVRTPVLSRFNVASWSGLFREAFWAGQNYLVFPTLLT